MNEFEDGEGQDLMGTERKSMVITEKEKRLTAYHEAGHAIVVSKQSEVALTERRLHLVRRADGCAGRIQALLQRLVANRVPGKALRIEHVAELGRRTVLDIETEPERAWSGAAAVVEAVARIDEDGGARRATQLHLGGRAPLCW